MLNKELLQSSSSIPFLLDFSVFNFSRQLAFPISVHRVDRTADNWLGAVLAEGVVQPSGGLHIMKEIPQVPDIIVRCDGGIFIGASEVPGVTVTPTPYGYRLVTFDSPDVVTSGLQFNVSD